MRGELIQFARTSGDKVLAAALTALALIDVAQTDASIGIRLATAALAVVLGLAAAQRSRDPLPLLSLFLAITLVARAVPTLAEPTNSGVFVFLLLAIYSAAAHTSGRRTRLAGAMTVGLYVTNLAMDDAGLTADNIIFFSLLFAAPWVAGRAIRQQRLDDRELEQEKSRAAAAIVEERARIARELHDVVAHSISVMVLQARGGRRVLESDPTDAREAFAVIESTGQQALDEMRRLVGMLRSGDEPLPLAPQPSLKELGTLVEQVRAAGLPVQLAVEGEPRDVPPGVDMSAFRIVQEALTNTLTHAGPARAHVVLRYLPDDLELEISDDGAGSADGSGFGSGYGLVGMRERVEVYGGQLEAGRRPGGGYALRVRLPLRSARV